MTTKPSIALADLVEKGADTDLLREMIHHIVERVMQFDVENLCAAGYGERTPERQNSRNGYRERLWETRAGSIAVKIPKLRSGSYFPPFLEPRRTAEKALAAVIQEAYVQGVSTRSVDELVKAMGMSGISKSQVSRLCAEIDERVNAFLNRPLEGDWPYLWIDATYVKGREAGRIVSKAVIIAVAVNAEGVREVLGMAIGPSEAEPFWTDFLRSLTRRGLRGVKLVISDAHEGLKAAAAKVLAATWQRCKVHFLRNALAHAGKGQRQMVLAAINTAFAQESFETASTQWRAVADQLRGKFPKLAELMDGAEADVLAYMTFPKAHRTQIHSTNPLERLNAEIKRRTDVVGIFPNEASITRLVCERAKDDVPPGLFGARNRQKKMTPYPQKTSPVRNRRQLTSLVSEVASRWTDEQLAPRPLSAVRGSISVPPRGPLVPFESSIERDFLMFCRTSHRVTAVHAQRLVIDFQDVKRGAARRYTPDFVVEVAADAGLSWRRAVVEVKTHRDLWRSRRLMRAPYAAARTWAAGQEGTIFRVVTDRMMSGEWLSSTRLLSGHLDKPFDVQFEQDCVAFLQQRDSYRISEILALAQQRGLNPQALLPVLYRMVARGQLSLDRGQPIGPQTWVAVVGSQKRL